jgi:hypothetical protein
MDQKKNPPKVEKLTEQVVPLRRLGPSTLDKPIPEEHQRIHRAVLERARRANRPPR